MPRLPYRLRIGIQADIDSLVKKHAGENLTKECFLWGKQMRRRLDEDDVGPERRVDLRQLAANRSCPEHHHARGQVS